jgi:hypothetical protein
MENPNNNNMQLVQQQTFDPRILRKEFDGIELLKFLLPRKFYSTIFFSTKIMALELTW